MILSKLFPILFLLAPEPGPGGGGAPTPPANDPPADPANDPPKDPTPPAKNDPPADPEPPKEPDTPPAYFSQLKKESQEKYKALSKYRNLDELAEAAMKGMESEGADMVKMPNEKSTAEELRAFLTKIGVPEKSDDYVLPIGKGEDTPFNEALRKQVREVAFRNALSNQQAQGMYGVIMAMRDSISKNATKQLEERVTGFDSRYEKLFEQDYPDKSKRDAAVQASMNAFKGFLSDTGLGEALKETYALYDERIVKGLADFAAKYNPGYVQGNNTVPKGGGSKSTGIQYNDDFEREYGSN